MGSLQKFPAFSQSKFIHDFTKLSDSMGAPYSLSAIQSGLTLFEKYLDDSAMVFRCTNRPGDILNFRLFLRHRVDTVSIAAKAGHIKLDDPLARLATSWSSLFDGDSEEWVDFNPQSGLAKTWIFFRKPRAVEEVFGLPELPQSVQAHTLKLRDLGLERVLFSAVDYHGRSLNNYFVLPGTPTDDQAARFTDLAGCSPPTQDELANMRSVMGPAFVLAVTIKFETGEISRVGFYALGISRLPVLDDQLSKFFAEMPSYDAERCSVVTWSYGRGNSKYMKGECGYSGELSALLAQAVAFW